MSICVNKMTLIGNVGQTPEVKQLQNGNLVTNISVATSSNYIDKTTGAKKINTEWHKVSFYGKLSEIASNYVKKGSKVYLEGKLIYKKWTDKNGVEKVLAEIVGNQLVVLQSIDKSSNIYKDDDENIGNVKLPSDDLIDSLDDDDIPF